MDNPYVIAAIAAGILFAIGLILGLLLVLAQKIFHVEEDPRIKDIEAMLPNANCGACGMAGCHDMAEALVKGDVKKVSLCKAGKKDSTYDPIIEYMKTHPDKDGKYNIPTI